MSEFHKITQEERAKLQATLLQMLKDLDFVCKKHNITYMLGGGSALGAVRHEGFIPWDDDLDLNMPRADYEKFIAVMHEELSDYYDFSYPGSLYVDYPFLKVYKKGTKFIEIYENMAHDGVWIDIFPIENVPRNYLHRIIKGTIADFLFHGVAASLKIAAGNDCNVKIAYGKSFGRKIRYYLANAIRYGLFWVSPEKVINIFDNLVQCKEESSLVTVPTGRKHYFGEIMEKSVIYPVRKAKFCDMEVNVYHRVEQYLTQLYGDYMKVPSENKREQHYVRRFSVDNDIRWKIN